MQVAASSLVPLARTLDSFALCVSLPGLLLVAPCPTEVGTDPVDAAGLLLLLRLLLG